MGTGRRQQSIARNVQKVARLKVEALPSLETGIETATERTSYDDRKQTVPADHRLFAVTRTPVCAQPIWAGDNKWGGRCCQAQ